MGTCYDQRAENNQMTDVTINQNHTWSGKKMELDNGLDTLECLRGRLLAERHASRVAKEDAESMANKFAELERKLNEEIKLRDKAERKLKLLKKKLESFNMSSCGSSSCSSASERSEGNVIKANAVNSSLLENAVHNHNVGQEAYALSQTKSQFNDTSCLKKPNQSSEDLKNDENRLSLPSSKSLENRYNSHRTDDYSSNQSPTYASTENICHNPNPSYDYGDMENDESRLSSLSTKSSSVIGNDEDHEGFIDNSLALVPVTFPSTSQATTNHKPVNESVVEALEALRRAKQGIICSMGTRLMIKVGPT